MFYSGWHTEDDVRTMQLLRGQNFYSLPNGSHCLIYKDTNNQNIISSYAPTLTSPSAFIESVRLHVSMEDPSLYMLIVHFLGLLQYRIISNIGASPKIIPALKGASY